MQECLDSERGFASDAFRLRMRESSKKLLKMFASIGLRFSRLGLGVSVALAEKLDRTYVIVWHARACSVRVATRTLGLSGFERFV